MVAPPPIVDYSEVAPQSAANAAWPFWQRILFRFSFVYFLLYSQSSMGGILARNLGMSWIQSVVGFSGPLLFNASQWLAIHAFHLSGFRTTRFPTGSGDTTLAYISNLCVLICALIVTPVWSALDRRRQNYQTMLAWFRIWVRYVLAFTLFGYGFLKVFPLQFQPPGPVRITEQFGDFSPMGVLWSFMGASIPYIMFSGCAEVLGGLLLVFRRTALLGAMVSFAVMGNVVALNFCYDVPVKLYSSNLLLMSEFLMAPDLPRLWRMFVLNQPVPAADTPPVVPWPRLRNVVLILWMLFVGRELYLHISGAMISYRMAYLAPKPVALYGLYDVESFSRNGKEVPPLLTEPLRWRQMMVQSQLGITVRFMDDSRITYLTDYKGPARTVNLSLSSDNMPNPMQNRPSDAAHPPAKYPLTYSWTDGEHLVLEGKLLDDVISVRLRKRRVSEFPLFNRGFHWITELPYNR